MNCRHDGYYESCAACRLADFAQRMFFCWNTARRAPMCWSGSFTTRFYTGCPCGHQHLLLQPLSDREHLRDKLLGLPARPISCAHPVSGLAACLCRTDRTCL